MADIDPQAQGAQFEDLFHELLSRLLNTDLGYEVLQHTKQGSGLQYGKDIQTKWRNDNGREAFWHFECKSHTTGVLHQREVADKIIDVYRSSHRIDTWCLTLANIEPGQWIDEFFAWAPDNFSLPFSLAVLSPQRGFIKNLFSCHPDLYRRMYPTDPTPLLSPREREALITSFAAFWRRQP